MGVPDAVCVTGSVGNTARRLFVGPVGAGVRVRWFGALDPDALDRRAGSGCAGSGCAGSVRWIHGGIRQALMYPATSASRSVPPPDLL